MLHIEGLGLEATREQIYATLGNVSAKFDTNKVLDEAGAILLNRIRSRFLAETDPDNVPWIKSKAGARRKRKGKGGTLFDTGTLFHSIQLHRVSPNDRDISTNVWYASRHQYGLYGEVMRRFLGFNDEDQSIFTKLATRRVTEFIKAELGGV